MTKRTIYLAGGCFWGTQRYLSLIPGVLSTEVGYANGNCSTVTYRQVCHDNTGHAETVKVIFDSDALLTERLLELFFEVIDPTGINRQGEDKGTQYRTGIYYDDAALLPAIERAMDRLKKQVNGVVAVEVLPLRQYCSAEAYHQDYLVKNPSGYCHIDIQKMIAMTAKMKKI